MTALMRTADRAARIAAGVVTATPPPRRRAKLVLLLRARAFLLQRQGDAMPTPRVIGGLDGQAEARH